MTRRFELGPIIVVLASLLLLVSLFLDWYGPGVSAWDAFEVVDLLLAALSIAAIVAAIGALAPEAGYLDRRWLPALVAAVAVLVAASIINPPPAAAGANAQLGAWIAFGAAMAMLIGAVLSIGRVSFSVALEGREPRERVAAVDERQATTETAAVMSSRRGRRSSSDGSTEATEPAEAPTRTDQE
ncbi:MAG: hypothetical protein QOK21_1163 [Solirubrobacteraceae bacterium]|nr:hypothetical protein [Solirubrobacteraceae bacterium]